VFALSTIERWYYQARRAGDPIDALRRRVRKDAGHQRAMGERLRSALRAQHADHRSWSYQLHFDNLRALGERHVELRPVPSYSTVLRYMKASGLLRERRRHPTPIAAGYCRCNPLKCRWLVLASSRRDGLCRDGIQQDDREAIGR
jgi:hypothetical protein